MEQDWTDGRTDGKIDGRAHTRTDECHFYSLPPPTSGDKKGSNSINTVDRLMVLAVTNLNYGPLSLYQVTLNYLLYF